MIDVMAIIMLACCFFFAKGNRSIQEHDEYWAQREWEEKNKERLKKNDN